MSRVFRKSTTRYLDAEGRQVTKDTPGARKVKEKSAKWYGRVPGSSRHVPLCENKAAAQIMLNELVRKARLATVGISDPYEAHRKRPLLEHAEDFRRALEAKGDNPRHVQVAVSRLKALLKGCGFVFMDDLSASRVADWLAGLRERGRERKPLEAGQESYTKRELAAALGVKPHCLPPLIRRWNLAVTGRGRARRFPRATAEALQERLCRGASVETTNQYLSHLKTFCRWLVKDRRMGENPFAHLEAGNAQVDRRHDRRELTAEELRLLLSAARDSAKTFRGLTGADRFHLYAVACGTGFRAGGLASLTPESFDLATEGPTVTLAARSNKSRRLKVQPLPPDVAALMRDYLRGKSAGQPLWGGTWARDGKGAEMLRIDLETAGIPYAVEGPDGPLYADFHALRHSYLTLGGRAGIDLRTLQELAGHSTPTLTARYSHRRLHDLTGAVEKLPNFLPVPEVVGQAEALRPTGTDGASDPAAVSVARQLHTRLMAEEGR
jgi:integrase